jgi:hypothetical protein
MKTETLCETVRIAYMASCDGDSDARPAAHEQHFLNCSSCRRWLDDVQSMTGQLRALSYPDARVDLWETVEGRIRRLNQGPSLPGRLWPIGAFVLAWRALQLFIDLPIPLLHPLVPLAALVVTLWLVAQDPLAIKTSAPELEKRGI